MNALLLLTASLLTARPVPGPAIDLAVAERTDVRTAHLVLLQADPRLLALCFDPEGLAPEVVARAREAALARPVWLYQGSRRVARGRLVSLESGPSALGPCAVAGEAEFEAPVPLTTASELLWASSQDQGSRSRIGNPKGALERARTALPEALAQSCMRPLATAVRSTASATYVNLVCEAPDGPLSLLLAVPRRGPARLLLADTGEEGRLSLLEALDSPEQQTLALGRDRDGRRALELWRVDGAEATRLPTWEH